MPAHAIHGTRVGCSLGMGGGNLRMGGGGVTVAARMRCSLHMPVHGVGMGVVRREDMENVGDGRFQGLLDTAALEELPRHQGNGHHNGQGLH